ncbi:MAG: M18 family aminopeptidase, partial [Clostridiales bacterium]|nr:M18 family aminopeptidase [Clostridiales bacterium]
SYTSYHATQNAAAFLSEHGFVALSEGEKWNLKRGGKYFVTRNGSSLIAFTLGKGNRFKIVARHTASPCFKLKEYPAMQDAFTRLNTEPYGGGLWYTFFDRPLKIAGRIIEEENGILTAKLYESEYNVVVPSLAIHMNRDANEKFVPDLQKELPLYATGKAEFAVPANTVSYDLFAVCAESPFEYGVKGEFVCAPRVDNLTSVYSSLCALIEKCENGICVAACLDNEEIGSRTRQGAGSDFLCATLGRVSESLGFGGTEYLQALSSSFLISLDNAHSLHPNHPEKCDPTNRAIMGGGVVIKGHAGGAYTSDALSSAVIKTIMKNAGVKYQTFYNRSDMRSGSTLGAISLSQVSLPSVDLGLPQLAMHSAMETFCKTDYAELEHALTAFYQSEIEISDNAVTVK